MPAPELTRAVAFHTYGGPEVLEMSRVPVGQPGPGEVRVRVVATPVNPADVWLRQGGIDTLMRGAQWPVVPGLELAGVVDKAGPGVDLRPGQAVVAVTTFVGTGRGAQAEQVVLDARDVVAVPPGLDLVAASTIPMSGLTALAALDRLDLPPGSALGVVGAAGAVGGYVVQLARERGLRVLALTAASDADMVTALGADVVVASREPRDLLTHAADGVDGLVDTAVLGAAVVEAVRPGGAVALMRPLVGAAVEQFAAARLRAELISVRAYQGDPTRLAGLVERAAQGRLATRVADVLAPAEAAQAHRRLEAGGVRGRLVLDWGRL